MLHRILFAFFAVTLVALPARADSVFVKGREKPILGTVKTEDGKGVTITPSGKKKTDEMIAAEDILDIHYDDLAPPEVRLAGGSYRIAKDQDKLAMESNDPVKRRTATTNAIFNYNNTLKKMNAHKYATRMIEYRIAYLQLHQAAADGTSSDKALDSLQSYKKRFPTSWQMNHVMPKIAELQISAKDFKGAEETFREIADLESLPIEVRREAELQVIQVNLKAGKADVASKKLDALEEKAKNNPAFLSRVKMTRAEILVGQKKMDQAVPLLRKVVQENTDRTIKAMAHNTLGECLFNAGQYNEALWEFLWVDAVFNDDKNQRAKALYFLWKTFEQTNNAERAQECRELLVSGAQYIGTQHHSLAIAAAGKK